MGHGLRPASVRCGVDDDALLTRRPEQAEAIARDHRNPDYLTDGRLPSGVCAPVCTRRWDFSAVDLVVMAVPSKAYAAVVDLLADRLPTGVAVLSLTKGVEPGTLRRLSEVVEDGLGRPSPRRWPSSPDPTTPRRCRWDQPTATVIASHDAELRRPAAATS